jgi:hypothetical protein
VKTFVLGVYRPNIAAQIAKIRKLGFPTADKTQLTALFKGSMRVVGRSSPHGVYNKLLSTYGREDRFNHRAAEGFIDLLGLQLQEYSRLHGGGA